MAAGGAKRVAAAKAGLAQGPTSRAPRPTNPAPTQPPRKLNLFAPLPLPCISCHALSANNWHSNPRAPGHACCWHPSAYCLPRASLPWPRVRSPPPSLPVLRTSSTHPSVAVPPLTLRAPTARPLLCSTPHQAPRAASCLCHHPEHGALLSRALTTQQPLAVPFACRNAARVCPRRPCLASDVMATCPGAHQTTESTSGRHDGLPPEARQVCPAPGAQAPGMEATTCSAGPVRPAP